MQSKNLRLRAGDRVAGHNGFGLRFSEGVRALRTTYAPYFTDGAQVANAAWAPAHALPTRACAAAQFWIGARIFDTPLTLGTTELFSRAAVFYGALFPSVRWLASEDLVICANLPSGAYPRGGLCIGRVFLTGSPPSERVINHERRHVAQWRRYGVALPLLYALSGRRAQTNWFEVDAGLADGNYV